MVENQIGKKNLVIDDCDAKQSVYIFGCKDSVLKIQGNNLVILWLVSFVDEFVYILKYLPQITECFVVSFQIGWL